MLQSAPDHGYFAVSFPCVSLAKHEYIQSVEVVVRCGRIASIRHLLEDWDLELGWENPSFLKLTSQARHFSAGLASVSELVDFITVQDKATSVSASRSHWSLTAQIRLAVERGGMCFPRWN